MSWWQRHRAAIAGFAAAVVVGAIVGAIVVASGGTALGVIMLAGGLAGAAGNAAGYAATRKADGLDLDYGVMAQQACLGLALGIVTAGLGAKLLPAAEGVAGVATNRIFAEGAKREAARKIAGSALLQGTLSGDAKIVENLVNGRPAGEDVLFATAMGGGTGAFKTVVKPVADSLKAKAVDVAKPIVTPVANAVGAAAKPIVNAVRAVARRSVNTGESIPLPTLPSAESPPVPSPPREGFAQILGDCEPEGGGAANTSGACTGPTPVGSTGDARPSTPAPAPSAPPTGVNQPLGGDEPSAPVATPSQQADAAPIKLPTLASTQTPRADAPPIKLPTLPATQTAPADPAAIKLPTLPPPTRAARIAQAIAKAKPIGFSAPRPPVNQPDDEWHDD